MLIRKNPPQQSGGVKGLYEKVIAANPHDYTSYFNLIRLYQRQKEPDKKIVTTIQRGLAAFPCDAGFYQESANYYFGSKQYDTARVTYEKYFKRDIDDTCRRVKINDNKIFCSAEKSLNRQLLF
ncbi:MAG: hypothetical protein J7L95_07635 [Prolixibacteraceae bacterium]|nr:hypothetical protein [Prolixibacteraceae bacterium]